jgi:hypothetical protein
MPTDGYWDRYGAAREVMNQNGGLALISTNTSVQRGTVHWRTAQAMAARQPSVFEIRDGSCGRELVTRKTSWMEPDRVIDMTEGVRYVEIRTPGGTIRVYTGLVTTHQNLPAVTVEITPSTRSKPISGDGGHWEAEVRDFYLDRTDVSLVRRGSAR